MIISRAVLRETTIPFRIAFNHTTKSRSEVEGIVLELETACGARGFGEALPRQYVTGETHESVVLHAKRTVLPALIGRGFNHIDEIRAWVADFYTTFNSIDVHEQCVRTLVEIAILDAFGKSVHRPLVALLGADFPPAINYSGVISAGKPAHVQRFVEAFQQLGVREYKLKVGGDWAADAANIQMVRDLCGDEVDLRADANEAWDLSTAVDRMARMADLGVSSCEQPMPVSAQADYPALVEQVGGKIAVCIDESLCTLADARWFIEHRGAQMFNLRVSKNGGIINTIALGQLAMTAGIRCQIGSQVGETSILSRAAQVVSACLGGVVHHEGAFGTLLLEYDLTEKPLMFGQGGNHVPKSYTGAGLGIVVCLPLLNRMVATVPWEVSWNPPAPVANAKI